MAMPQSDIEEVDVTEDEDIEELQRCVQRHWTPESEWHVGDLAWRAMSWNLGDLSIPPRMWIEDGDVVAWAWLDNAHDLGWDVLPTHPHVAARVIEWFESVARTGPKTASIVDCDAVRARALRNAGYQADLAAPFYEHLRTSLEVALEEPEIPEGFMVRHVRDDEIALRAHLHREAWGTLPFADQDPVFAYSRIATESYERLTTLWPYRPELDWVIESPTGQFVAGALGWMDEMNWAGALEPVGVHPDYHRRGFGRAVSLAVLRALQNVGAVEAIVCPRGDVEYPVPRKLYGSLGFRAVGRTVTYTKAD